MKKARLQADSGEATRRRPRAQPRARRCSTAESPRGGSTELSAGTERGGGGESARCPSPLPRACSRGSRRSAVTRAKHGMGSCGSAVRAVPGGTGGTAASGLRVFRIPRAPLPCTRSAAVCRAASPCCHILWAELSVFSLKGN